MKRCRKNLHSYSNDLKFCPDCSLITKRNYYLKNKDKIIEKAKLQTKDQRKRYSKNWLTKNPDYFKNDNLQRKYNLTIDQWNQMQKDQNGLCIICFKREATDVDHDHESMQIRGLLCNSCNRAIGLLHEDIHILNNAIKYLEKFDA